MLLYTETPEYFADIADEIRLFFGQEKIVKTDEKKSNADDGITHCFWCEEGVFYSAATLLMDGKAVCEAEKRAVIGEGAGALEVKKRKKRLVKNTVYELLKKHFGKRMPWGSLTGIRPTKLLRELMQERGDRAALETFRSEFDVSEEKIRLARDIVCTQRESMERIRGGMIDVYIGIPFCATRCKYCSFISRDLRAAGALKGEYLEALEREMEALAPVVNAHEIRALYIGGGTPTALTEGELARLLGFVTAHLKTPGEFTVEAGRPDTVTKEKLEIIRAAGAKRISINTQTTNEKTLGLIGRAHSVEEFETAFLLAREVGFDAINTDIILGLPGERVGDIKKTLDDVLKFAPENVTVHSLAIKRASHFAEESGSLLPEAGVVNEMAEYSTGFLEKSGYLPYYLYRQKYMGGNLENVGWALPGKICDYNIDNMEEMLSVVALGAGGISKRIFGGENRIERAANVKDVSHYIKRVDEMIARKKTLFEKGRAL